MRHISFARQFFKNCIPALAFLTFLILVNMAIPYLLFVSLALLFVGCASYKLGQRLQEEPATLLTHLTQLRLPEKKLLTLNETEQFKKFANPEELERLQDYEKYISEKCMITFTEIPELQFPVTIEHANENPHFAKTYEKEALIHWLQHRGTHATEPQKRWYRLDDPHINIYAGYPNWVVKFINEVLVVLKNPPKPQKEKEREQFQQKNFKALFSHQQQNIPEEKTNLLKNSRMYIV